MTIIARFGHGVGETKAVEGGSCPSVPMSKNVYTVSGYCISERDLRFILLQGIVLPSSGE
jgi:hypothetical protein